MILNDCACPLSPLNFIGSTYPCHFDGQVRSRHALRCPKAIHGSAALCSGLQGDVSDMILVVKLLRYIIICPSLRQKINHNIIWLTINSSVMLLLNDVFSKHYCWNILDQKRIPSMRLWVQKMCWSVAVSCCRRWSTWAFVILKSKQITRPWLPMITFYW